jgi:ABC-type thiamine transport system substrate-binding protein
VRRYVLCLLLVLAACAQQKPSFIGNWVAPGDAARRLAIGAHEGFFVNTASGHTVKMRYILRSATEAAFVDEKGTVKIICDLSDDGENMQMFVQKPYGSGMYNLQRIP